MNKLIRLLIVTLAIVLVYTSCNDYIPVQKPRGYFEIVLPKKGYQQFNKPEYPFSFRYPVYAQADKDTNLFKNNENPYWINISFPSLSGKIFMSYKVISAEQPLAKLINDSYELSAVHDKRASYRYEDAIKTKNNVYGIFYRVGGNAASAYQFILTDSVKHFVRGALYFAATPNADSLLPVNNFVKQDLDTLIQSLKWTK